MRDMQRAAQPSQIRNRVTASVTFCMYAFTLWVTHGHDLRNQAARNKSRHPLRGWMACADVYYDEIAPDPEDD
jgi:hypothetical protein